MLGFEQIGEERICKQVDAPAVLLRLDLEYMRENILRNQATRGVSNKSIYGYFLNKHEEQDILALIQNQPEHLIKSEKEKLSSERRLSALNTSVLNTGSTSTLLYSLFIEAVKGEYKGYRKASL